MDTSKTYIEMCDCPEIQENRPEHGGDFFHEHGWFDCTPQIYCDCRKAGFDSRHFKTNYVWLPRQDQLQEMVEKRYTLDVGGDYNHWLGDLLTWFEPFWRHYGMNNETTLEQLWLAFVMKEKHDKVWNGKWVDRV